MNKKSIEQLKTDLGIIFDEKKSEILDNYMRIFLEKNSRLNLISKNDEKLLFEKHIFDSLAINLFFKHKTPNKGSTLLDIGTGGGFPSIPIAILMDKIYVYPLDSIRKKIKAVEEIGAELDLKNLFPICDRAENLSQKFDLITSRAVAPLDVVLKYAMPSLKKGGYFIAYKSKKATGEIDEAKMTLKKFRTRVVDVIEYKLPLEEVFERNLIVIEK